MERVDEDKCSWFLVVSSEGTTTEDLRKDHPNTACLTCQGNNLNCVYYASHRDAVALKRKNPDKPRIKPQ